MTRTAHLGTGALRRAAHLLGLAPKRRPLPTGSIEDLAGDASLSTVTPDVDEALLEVGERARRAARR